MDTRPVLMSQITIEVLGAMRVACYPCIGKEPEAEGRNFLAGWLYRKGIAAPIRYFGFGLDVTPEQKNEGLRGYEVWATVPEDVTVSEGVTIKSFQGGLYAGLLLEHPFDDLFCKTPPAWKTLHEWVICSDSYRGASHQWLEELIINPGTNDLKLYYPVKPVNGNRNNGDTLTRR